MPTLATGARKGFRDDAACSYRSGGAGGAGGKSSEPFASELCVYIRAIGTTACNMRSHSAHPAARPSGAATGQEDVTAPALSCGVVDPIDVRRNAAVRDIGRGSSCDGGGGGGGSSRDNDGRVVMAGVMLGVESIVASGGAEANDGVVAVAVAVDVGAGMTPTRLLLSWSRSCSARSSLIQPRVYFCVFSGRRERRKERGRERGRGRESRDHGGTIMLRNEV